MNFNIELMCCLNIVLLSKYCYSIIDFEFAFQKIAIYLQKYNDVSIDTVITVYPGSLTNSSADSHSTCFGELSAISKIDKWAKYIRLVKDQNYLERLRYDLNRNDNSLIILCCNISYLWIQRIFDNLSSFDLSENTWLLLNPSINMSRSSWVSSISRYFDRFEIINYQSQIYIFQDRDESGELYEIYRPCQSQQVKINTIQKISNLSTTSSNSEFIWKRRQNLMGCEFDAGYIEQNYGFYAIKEADYCPKRIVATNKIICRADRWYTSLVMQLIVDFNMTLSFVNPKDNQYGVKKQDSENWTGVVGLLQHEKVEFAFVLLTFTTDRDEVMDFGLDLGFEYLVLYMAKPKTSFSHISYIGVFNICYWILLLGSGLLVCCCFAFLQNINRRRENDVKAKYYLRNINAGISLTYRALLGLDVYSAKHVERTTSKMSIRICLVTACLLGMFNRDTFYAGLASLLTIEPPLMPINSLEDVLTNPGYRLSVMEGTTIESYFSDSEDSIAKKLWDKRETKIISNTGKIMAEKQILSDTKIVYVGTESFQEVSMNYPCSITKLSQMYGQKSYGFGFRTHSPYQKLFNYKISQYKTYGIKSQLKKDTEKASTMGCNEAEEHWHALSLSNIPLPFSIILIGMAIALVFLILEALVHYKDLKSNKVKDRRVIGVRYKYSVQENVLMMKKVKIGEKPQDYLNDRRRRSSF